MPTPTEVADSLEPEFRRAFLAIIDVVRGQIPVAQLEALLDTRDFVGILNIFEEVVGEALTFSAASDLSATYTALVTRSMTPILAGTASFNLVSQLVVDKVRSATGNLIVGVGQGTILSVRSVMEQNYIEGLGSAYAARQLRAMIGLLPAHAGAVGRFSLALQDDNIPEARRINLVETYAQRLLNYRASNISRTESISASEGGRVAGWVEQANRGILQRHRTVMEWMVTEDDRLCPWCAPMDGQQVGIGDYFMSTVQGFPEGKPEMRGPGSERKDRLTLRPDPRSQPRDAQGRFVSLRKRDNRDYLDGKLVERKRPAAVPHPPLHPQCRCTLVLRFSS